MTVLAIVSHFNSMPLKGQYKCTDNGKKSDFVTVVFPLEMTYVIIRNLKPSSYLWTLYDSFFSEDILNTWMCIVLTMGGYYIYIYMHWREYFSYTVLFLMPLLFWDPFKQLWICPHSQWVYPSSLPCWLFHVSILNLTFAIPVLAGSWSK